MCIQVLNNSHTPTFCLSPSDPLKLQCSYQSHISIFSLSFRAHSFSLCHIVSEFIPPCPLVLSMYVIKEEVCHLSILSYSLSLVPVVAQFRCTVLLVRSPEVSV